MQRCMASNRLVARGRLPQAGACYHVSLSVRGRQSLQKPPASITAAFSVRQELQWGCRGLATGKQDIGRFENVIEPLLRAYFTHNGHCEVPEGYKVTAEHLAAANLSSSDCKIGFGLGNSLRQIATKGAHDIDARTDRQAALDAIDCDWAGERRFERIVMALQWFKATEGHMDLPYKLVLDEVQCAEAGMPEHVKEFRLGETVNHIRSRGDYVQTEDPNRQAQCAANKETLDSTNFIWDPYQHRFDCYIKPAVSWFTASEGHSKVPTKLVLDEAQCRKAGLPEHATEFRLGQTADNIRYQGHFVQTKDPSRQAQYAENKNWLNAIFDKGWLWAKLPSTKCED